MKNIKKILAGLTALTMTAGLTACGGSENGGDTSAETTTTAATTTAKTVAINTETLKAEEEDILADVMSDLQDVELENKTVKWLAHYDINPSSNGASKSVGLEMFEKKYGGTIEWVPTTWNTRFDDLSTKVLGGDGVDIFPGDDVANFPKGIVSGMFQPIDDYIDINSAVWQNTKTAMELVSFGGKHFEFVTDVQAETLVIYNKATIEANGLDDPWDLYEKGEWNWDTFKQMLLDFVDEDSDQWGLDGYWNEKALLLSAGVPFVGTNDEGGLVCNVNDATIESAMNFQYDLFNNGLILPMEQFNWQEQPQMMGEGRQLFYIVGSYAVSSDPETWSTGIDPEDLGLVPVPSPAGSDPYQTAKLIGYALCKGSANPQGAALFSECTLLGTMDERAAAISDRKALDDYQWSQEILDHNKEINELARKYPVIDLATGCSADIASLTTDGGSQIGLRAAFHGIDWATNRETIADTIIMLVDEVDQDLKAKLAE
ncbi:MAG: ABC transporter substrate-binding protein [Oscillospiraceae bacterium]